MRMLAWCFVGLTFMLAGCGTHECASTSDAKTKVSATTCNEDDCCSSVTRAGLLKKSVESKQEADEIESK